MRKKVDVVRKAFLAVYSTDSFIGLSRPVYVRNRREFCFYIYGYQRTSCHSSL